MNERSAVRGLLPRSLGWACVLALVASTPGCGDADPPKPTKVEPAKASSAGVASGAAATKAAGEGGDAKADSGPAEGEGGQDDDGEGAGAEAGAAEGGAAEGGAAEGGAAEGGAAEGGAAEGGAAEGGAAEGGAAEGGAAEGGEPAADPKALLKEVAKKRTKDDRALAALAEAEAAGAEVRDLAKAAKKRGDALYSDTERAAKFYQWAADKDPKYPDPVFALAKQSAIKGDIDDVKKLLTQVKERKGKKLLQQIEFDPMWDIVKDDPDVRALLR